MAKLVFSGWSKAMGLGDPTFGLFLSFILFLLCREMIVGKANKTWTMEGFSEYFSLLSGATGVVFFYMSSYHYAKHDAMC